MGIGQQGTTEVQVGSLLTCPSFKRGGGDSLVLVPKVTGTFFFERLGVQKPVAAPEEEEE